MSRRVIVDLFVEDRAHEELLRPLVERVASDEEVEVEVRVRPALPRWARERAGLGIAALEPRFAKLDAWERGEARPTAKQLKRLARATHAPLDFLFLHEPPAERVPIPDFRTVDNVHLGHPSVDLLDTVYVCPQHQEWYRDFARSTGEESLAFVGSAQRGDDVETIAADIRRRADGAGFGLAGSGAGSTGP